MIARWFASIFCLVLGACDVDSTVGYNESEGALIGGERCAPGAPLARCSTGPCVVTNLFEPRIGSITLAVDADNAYFLTDPLALAKRPLDGSGPSVDLATTDSPLIRMTVDQSYVYWTELDGNVRGVPKAGGQRFDAGYVFGNPTDITVDRTHLYWVFPEFGQVAMAPKPAGEATHIAGQDSPQAIAVDATHVYWVNGGAAPQTGQLVRAPRGNLGGAEAILTELDAPVAIAVSDDAVYWASRNAVFRMLKDGSGTVETVAGGFSEVKGIAAFGDAVYGAGMEGLWRVPASGGEALQLDRRAMSGMTITCAGVYATGWFDSVFVRYAP
jgi:hypothetical protein